MTKAAFDKIAAGLGDAIAYAQGDESRGRRVDGIDFKAVRAATGKSQSAFAKAYHLPLGTIRDWEQNRRQPDAPARILLAMIAAEPDVVEKIIARAR